MQLDQLRPRRQTLPDIPHPPRTDLEIAAADEQAGFVEIDVIFLTVDVPQLTTVDRLEYIGVDGVDDESFRFTQFVHTRKPS